MTVARITTWVSGQVLTAAALNAEFNNLINNANSLISPFTASVSAGGFNLNALATGTIAAPSFNFNGLSQTGAYIASSSQTGTVASLNLTNIGTRFLGLGGSTTPTTCMAAVSQSSEGGELSWFPARVSDYAAPSTEVVSMSIYSFGTGSNCAIRQDFAGNSFVVTSSAGSLGGANNPALYLEVGSSAVAQGMFQDQVVRAWCKTAGGTAPVVRGSFGVASVTDGGVGSIAFNWTNQFSGSTSYVVTGIPDMTGSFAQMVSLGIAGQSTASATLFLVSSSGNIDPTVGYSIMAMGLQA